MLLQFSASNHRSIKERVTISMKASSDKAMLDCLSDVGSQKKVVPAAAIYGANSAGKSNILHAMMLMKDMVCGKWAQPLKGDSLPQESFFLQEEKGITPTSFDIIYYYNGILYAYGFSFSKSRIVNEYLYHWPKGREALIFSREGEHYIFRENIQEQTTLAKRTANNKLYLTSSNEWNCPQTENAYRWFQLALCGLVADANPAEMILHFIQQAPAAKEKLLEQIRLADLGIYDILISGTQEQPIISIVHQITSENGKTTQFTLRLDQESAGTKRFISHIGEYLTALDNGGVLIVDDIESNLHPLLTKYLVELFQAPVLNKNHAQLIFTTHSPNLLDLSLLRRDQFWFVEKDSATMQTELFSLIEFSPRKNEDIKRGYLQGRYGAIPFIQ